MISDDDTRVRDLMTVDVEGVTPDTTITEFCRLTASGGFAGVPVLDDGDLVGIVTRSDVIEAMVKSGADDSSSAYEDISELLAVRFIDLDEVTHPRRFTYVEEIMVRDVITVASDATIQEAARLMYSKKIHRIPVVDEGRLVGIISTLDLMRYLAD